MLGAFGAVSNGHGDGSSESCDEDLERNSLQGIPYNTD